MLNYILSLMLFQFSLDKLKSTIIFSFSSRRPSSTSKCFSIDLNCEAFQHLKMGSSSYFLWSKPICQSYQLQVYIILNQWRPLKIRSISIWDRTMPWIDMQEMQCLETTLHVLPTKSKDWMGQFAQKSF